MAAPVIPIRPEASHSDLAETMSPSQLLTMGDCGFKYWCTYGLKIQTPKSSALALGSAVDDAINANYRLKIETREDLPIQDVLLEFDAAWGEVEEQTEFRDDEDAPAIAAQGRELVTLYMTDAAPHIQPIAVQHPVSGAIGGVRVNGIIDLIDDHGKIHDLKTSARKLSRISTRDRMQLSAYALISPIETREVQIDQLVKKKTPEYVKLSESLTDQDLTAPIKQFPMFQEAIREGGYFLPARNSPMCNRKYCPHWRLCEREYGGTIPGGEE